MNRLFSRAIVLAGASFVLALATADCAGKANLDGRACPCADGYRCCATADVCVGPGDVCPAATISSAATVERVCSAEHGPVLGPPRTASAFASFLARRWFACFYDPRSNASLVSHEGIEFGTDGTWGFLHPTANGYERSTAPADTGTYQVWNDTLTGFVPTTDMTQGHDLHLFWTESRGPLTLYFDFEYAPLRFRTTNGIELWFVADGGDGSDLVGSEGTSCESDHAICKPGSSCVSEHNAEMCSKPAMNLPVGAGCDNRMVRTCMPPLECRADTRQCGERAP